VVQAAEHRPEEHLGHDKGDAVVGVFGSGSVVHRQDDACYDLHHEQEERGAAQRVGEAGLIGHSAVEEPAEEVPAEALLEPGRVLRAFGHAPPRWNAPM